ncbi:hypothetical protein Taro_052391 [Colocasia esculenta]|uniref:Protein TPX2 n=1 Tax=Colocasia esculenta TaxID=4460 RepID=A0A843XK25_COLES|nr:hypothetical protein [Colocasia esculenta]
MEVGAAASAPDGGVGGECKANAAAAAIPVQAFQIDHVYEFSAPRFFDFSNEETEEEMQRAELWFETALSYSQSPFIMGVKGGRSIRPESLCCDFGDVEQQQISTDKMQKIETDVSNNLKEKPTVEEDKSGGMRNAVVAVEILEPQKEEKHNDEEGHTGQVRPSDACTPNAPRIPGKGSREPGSKNQTAKRIASLIQKTSTLKPKDQPLPIQDAIITQKSVIK